MGFLDLVHPPSQSVVHLAKNSFYLGCITFSDEVKSGMKETIANLKKVDKENDYAFGRQDSES